MFFRPLAFAFLVVGGATAQDTAPVSTVRTDASSALGSTLSNVLSTVPSTVPGTQASSEEGFMTIQTSVPSSIATDGESTSACLEVCVMEPCTQCVHSRQPSPPISLLTCYRPFDEPPAHDRNDPPTHLLRWRLHKHALRIGNWANLDTAGRDTRAYKRHLHECRIRGLFHISQLQDWNHQPARRHKLLVWLCPSNTDIVIVSRRCGFGAQARWKPCLGGCTFGSFCDTGFRLDSALK